jgi:DNA-binding MarR family transcriptional regulator
MLSKQLQDLGLSAQESLCYQELLRRGPQSATVLAEAVGVTRSGVYPVVHALVEKGLVEGGTGYGSRFHAVTPSAALKSLVAREREVVELHERLAEELIADLSTLVTPDIDGDAPTIEILRDRRLVGERYERLQLEATQGVDVTIKGPIVGPKDNPVEEVCLESGIPNRSLYESDVLEDEELVGYVERWVSLGEEARVFPGSLPLKFALFDRVTVLMPLETPREPQGVTAVLIRHASLGAALGILFDTFWASAESFTTWHARQPAQETVS